MRIFIEKDFNEMSLRAARIIAEQVRQKPESVLGLATGSTPLGTYQELIRIHREEGLDFSKVVTFNLDEYCGLSQDNPQSYHYYMYENFFKHINVKHSNIHIPDGMADDIENFCISYDELIKQTGGIDIQLLGIGRNGHIGFNEPAEELSVPTHLVELTQDTIEANSRFFDSMEQVPKQAITMGMGPIMQAKKILLLANGEGKAEIMGELLNNSRVTTKIPASFLWLHGDAMIIMDEAAAKYTRG
ncbi:MAG: glucosamine-6-phosphate deaminase [Tepidanaerobacteraceae bacterium]|jgi:glucosamine-6-phosphate deaminase